MCGPESRRLRSLQITDATFDGLVAEGKPMVVDFWATWCGPCRMVGPIIDELAAEYEGRAIIGKSGCGCKYGIAHEVWRA